MKLSKKTVLCVRTSERNIARLKVSTLDEVGALNSRTTFDTVARNAN